MKNKFSIALSFAVVLAMLLASLVFADAATDQSISINGGAAETNSLSVVVNVSVLHCPPGGDMQALEVAFRNDPLEPWTVVHAGGTPWPGGDDDGCTGGSGSTAYPASFAWDLASGPTGLRTVYARFKHAGDEVFAQDDINFVSAQYHLFGFYRPVEMDGIWNTVKGGSTVPLKFNVFDGDTELTDVSVVQSFTTIKVACEVGGEEDAVDFTATGGTSLRYDTDAGQFIQNWKTPKTTGCYQVTMKTDDGSTLTAFFKLK